MALRDCDCVTSLLYSLVDRMLKRVMNPSLIHGTRHTRREAEHPVRIPVELIDQSVQI